MPMTAWQLPQLGEPAQALQLAELPIPTPGDGQLLVRVRTVALNFPDVLMVQGKYQDRPPLPFTPGIEFCGDVVDGGQDCGFSAGKRVIGGSALPAGGLAEYALANHRELHAAPDGMDDARASALTVAYQTGWMALVHRAAVRPGETVLVHAGAGGVGSAATAIAKAIGARVVAVVGSAEKVSVARDLGADEVVDRSAHPTLDELVAALKSALGPGGADVVFDPVGGDSFLASTKVIAFEGRLLVIGFAGGTIPTLQVNHALVKNYSVLGVLWGAYRSRAPQLIEQAWSALDDLLAGGMPGPFIWKTIEFDQAADGLAELAAGRTMGRVVVRVAL